MPELTQLESGKSMIRNLPAKGTEGLARFSERTLRRAPSPPARIMATIRTENLQHMRRPRQERVHYTIGCGECHAVNSLRQRQQRWLDPQQYAGNPQCHPTGDDEEHQRQ